MKTELTYKFRIYPTRQQTEIIRRTCAGVRYVYNKLLEDRTMHYRATGKWKSLELDALKEKPFLKNIDPAALICARNSLITAYNHFQRTERTAPDKYRLESLKKAQSDPTYKLMDTDLAAYPRFKKKKSSKESYTTTIREFAVNNGRTPLPYLGNIKIKYHRPLPEGAQILSATVLKTAAGHYFLLLRFEMQDNTSLRKFNAAIGVALQPGRPAVRSDGVPIIYRHIDENLEKKIERAYQTLRRRKPGSKRYEKQRLYLASLYEHRVNQRRDDLHKAARQITNAADAIYVQQANVRKALKLKHSRAERTMLLDEATWTFTSFVQYKAHLEGKWVWFVPREALIYSMCSECGAVRRPEPIANWNCSCCGSRQLLYQNAARNLQKIGEQYIRNCQQ